MRLQGETRELTVVLTDEELVLAGTKLCEAVQDADGYEEELEGRKADWRETLKTMKEELSHRRKVASEAAEIVRTGEEKRDVGCTWKYALAAGWAFLVRDDTGERIFSRKLKDEERQMTIGEPPFAEPTPEELEEWLKTLPVNEQEVLPEGHADEVETGDRAVDLSPGGTVEDWEGDEEYDDDDGPATPAANEHAADPFEEADSERPDDESDDEDGEDTSPANDPHAIVTDLRGEPLDEPVSAGSLTPSFNPNPGLRELASLSDAEVAALRKRQQGRR